VISLFICGRFSVSTEIVPPTARTEESYSKKLFSISEVDQKWHSEKDETEDFWQAKAIATLRPKTYRHRTVSYSTIDLWNRYRQSIKEIYHEQTKI